MPKPVFHIAVSRLSFRPQVTPCIDCVPDVEPGAFPAIAEPGALQLEAARREAEAGTLDWQSAIAAFLAQAARWRGDRRESV